MRAAERRKAGEALRPLQRRAFPRIIAKAAARRNPFFGRAPPSAASFFSFHFPVDVVSSCQKETPKSAPRSRGAAEEGWKHMRQDIIAPGVLRVRLFRPDGREEVRTLPYRGKAARVRFGPEAGDAQEG